MAVDIGPKIGIQGEREFREQINQTNQALKTLAAEGKAVTSSFNDETDAEKKAAAQKDVLNRQIEAQKDKLALLERGLKESAQMYGEADTRTMKWQQAVHEATAKLNGMEKELDDVDKGVDETTDSMEDAGDAAKGWADVMKGQLLADAVKTGLKTLVNLGKKAASAMWDASKAGAAYADEILTSATVTGLSTDELQEFRYMSDLVDVSVETMTGSLTKLTGTMDKARNGNKDATAAFEKLGIKVTDSNGRLRNSNEVFREVIDALGKMESGTERDAFAMDILGKSAKDLNPLIDAGADTMAELAKEAHDTGYVLSGDALTALGKQQDAMDRLNRKTEGLKNTFAQGLAPGITKAYDTIGEAMSNPRVQRGTELLGEGIGNIIGKAADLAARVLPDLMLAFSDDVQLRLFTDHEIELAKRAEDAAEAYQAMRDTFSTNAQGIMDERQRVEDLWKELQTLTKKNGEVKDGQEERVDYILNELNEALGTEYERNGDIIKQYAQMREEIDKLIQQKTAEKLLAASDEAFADARAKRDEALQLAGEWYEIVEKRQAALAEAQQRQAEFWEKNRDAYNEGDEDEVDRILRKSGEYLQAVEDAEAALAEASKEYETASTTAQSYYDTVYKYEQAQSAALQGNYEDAIRYMTDEMGITLEYYAQKEALSEADREKLQAKIRETEQAMAEYKRQLEAGSTGFSKEGLKELEGYVKDAKAILDGKTVGRSWLSGIKTGLESGDLKRQIQQAAQRVASSIKNITNQTLEIKSPSRVAAKIGNYWDMGLIKGLEQKETEIAKAATSLADTISTASTPTGGLSVSYGNGGLTAAGTGGGTSSYQTNLGGITIQVPGAGAVNEDILAQRISVRLTDELIRAQRGGRL